MVHSGSFAHGANRRRIPQPKKGKVSGDPALVADGVVGETEETIDREHTYATEESGVVGRQMTWQESEDDQGGPPTVVSR